MFVPQRIHKSRFEGDKLNAALPNWEWELRGDYWYPVLKEVKVDPAIVERLKFQMSAKPRLPGKWWVPLIPFAVFAVFMVLYFLFG